MKKFLAIAAIAVSLVACNSGGDASKTEDTTTVTTPATVDTAAVAPMDTAAKAPVVDTAKAAITTDTTKTK